MQRKVLVLLLLVLLFPALLLAGTTGKIRGKVTDRESGEPLVGATVSVVGTSVGSFTDINGEYIILNIEVGTYQLKVSYVGYQAITLSNVRVNADLTTEANFQLPVEGVTVPTVEIFAERPLVNKSATNAVRIIDQEFFANYPGRGSLSAIAIQPGVVYQNQNVYIRGGRADETGYRMEGVNTNNPLFGGQALSVPDAAVEQIQVQAGGYNAEYGGANAGLVSSQLRTGSPNAWRASVLYETDNYTKQGKKSLGGYSYGYYDGTATLGGPLLGRKLRFFGSVQNTFYRDPSVNFGNTIIGNAASPFRDPWDFSGANAIVTETAVTYAHATARPDTLNLVFRGGNPTNGMNNLLSFAGTLLADLNQIQIKGAGSYTYNEFRNQATLAAPNILTNIFNTSRLPLTIQRNSFGNVKLSHLLSASTFYELNFNFFNTKYESMDPDLRQNVLAYGDSTANAALGYQLYGQGVNYGAWRLWGGAFAINQPGTQIAGYEKRDLTSVGGRGDFTTQYKQHSIKFGGEYTRYTIRRYAPAGVFGWARLARDNPDLLEQALLFKKVGGIGSDVYGYDILGNEINDDVLYYRDASGKIVFGNGPNAAYWDQGPRHPVFAAAYVQDKIEFSDIILNLGLRYDYIDPNSLDSDSKETLHFNSDDFILASLITKTAPTKQVSPRVGFSFPVTDRTVFHAQYGKYIQQTQLRDSYFAPAALSGLIKGGFFVQNTAGFGLKPTRTTQYEMGFAQQVSDIASFDITAFYKDIQDQVQFTYIIPGTGSETGNYSSFVNGDFATTKGIEFRLSMRRTSRVLAQLYYTLQDARTTSSNPGATAGIWSAGSIVQYPHFIFPADADQAQRGSVQVDYRFDKGDGGPILQQLGLNLVLGFNSGHPFTLLRADQRGPAPGDPRFRIPLEPIGSSTTPWFFELDARLDKTVSISGLDANFYIYVINVLGTDNAVNSFFRTGDPKDDGWFGTETGQSEIRTLGPQYVAAYNAFQLGRNSGNFGPPRQIRFGLRLVY